MKTETFVTFEQAQALKRLGFDWLCRDYYYEDDRQVCLVYSTYKNRNKEANVCSAPTLCHAKKWLWEVKHIEVNAFVDYVTQKWQWYNYEMNSLPEDTLLDKELFYETYEAALSAGITVALKKLEANNE